MFYAVIMAGGSGTRLWPLSCGKRPKQALTLVGERSMFQYAVDRVREKFGIQHLLIVTQREHCSLLSAQAPDIAPDNYIIEPFGRGTAPAIGLAAICLHRWGPDTVMAVLPADHYISNIPRFINILNAACKAASRGHLVTLGIKPTSASCGFGYIKQGAIIDTIDGFPVFSVSRFVEKPDATKAIRMVESGEYTWNSGMFIWRVDAILNEFKRHMPAFFTQLQEIEKSVGSSGFQSAIDRIWPEVAKETIDYGIMEKAQSVAVIPADIGWRDVGSWSSLFELLPLDRSGNAVKGRHVGIDTHDTLVFGDKRLIATIGIKDMIIVDTEDALLLCPKDREQEVRDIVRLLDGKKA